MINTKKCRFCKGSLVIDETLPVSLFCDDDAKNVIYNRAYIFKYMVSLAAAYPDDVILKYATFYWIGFNEIQNNPTLMMRFCNASSSCHLFCFVLDLVVSDNYNNFLDNHIAHEIMIFSSKCPKSGVIEKISNSLSRLIVKNDVYQN